MLDCLFKNAPEGIESHTITEVEDYFISAELDGIAYQAIQTKFYFTGTPKLRVNLVKDGNVKPVTSINQKLNYGGLIEDYPVGYIFTVENGNEDVVLNAAPVPGKDDPKPDPKPEPKPEPEPEAPTYTLTVKGGTFTYNGSEAMTSASVPVDAEVKVTLNQSAVPEGMVFDLWAMDEASLLGNPAVAYNEESFTIPAGSVAKGSTVTVEAQYRDATIESEPSVLGTAAIIGVAGAGTAVIVWQGYRIGMELYEKYFQPTPEETAAEQPARKLRQQLPLPERRRTRSLPRLTELHKTAPLHRFRWGGAFCGSIQAQRQGKGHFLVGNAGCAILHMDDAALGKAVFFQQVLHDLVVGVGVGPQALAVLQTPGDHSGGNARVPARRSQPVDGAVGQGIVQPLAILDPGIGGVRAKDKGKHALQLAVDKVEEQPVGINVLFQQLLRREMISPLGGVARIRHRLPGRGHKFSGSHPDLHVLLHETSSSNLSLPAGRCPP